MSKLAWPMEDAAQAVAPPDVESGELARIGDRFG